MLMVWMEVTQDKYQLPVAVAESIKELSMITGTPKSAISQSACRMRNGQHLRGRFLSVEIEEEGDDDG